MLRIYRHRVNDLSALEQLEPGWGLELDLRSDGDRVIVTHDPFTDGPTIETFFSRIGNRPCIFNVKCEGVEERVRSVAKQHDIDDYFFLDCSVPAAMKLARAGERRFAVRYSEVEPVESVLAWRGKATWVWVDCFTRYPDEPRAWSEISEAFRVCLVSPELQGHSAEDEQRLRGSLAGRAFEAVCTKVPSRWVSPP